MPNAFIIVEKVRLKLIQQTASGARKSWSKKVIAVDLSAQWSKSFIGKYIRGEFDACIGDVIVTVIPFGPLSRAGKTIEVGRVTLDGLQILFTADYQEEFLSIRDKIAELVGIKSERSIMVEKIDNLINFASEETLSEVIEILKRCPKSEYEE